MVFFLFVCVRLSNWNYRASGAEALKFGAIPKIPLRRVVPKEEDVPHVAGTKRKADDAEIDDGSGRSKKLREEDGVVFLDDDEPPRATATVIEIE
jgi:hypothetical protein